MKEDNIKRVIKACLSIALLAVILVIVVTIMMKYNVEGEKICLLNFLKLQ